MRTKLVTAALVGTLGVGGAVLLAPGLASADSPAERVTRIKDALQGLVSDKTITQEQADRVAETLAQQAPHRGHRGPRGLVPPEATAQALGITVEELREQRRAGRSLAQIAESRGISRDVLVDRLVAAAEKAIAAAVTDGRLTQERADALRSGLEARISAKVDRVGGPRHEHRRGERPAPQASPSVRGSSG